MHKAMIGLCLLLLPALVWAGTWRDDFDDGDLAGWEPFLNGGQVANRDGKIVVTDTNRSIASGVSFSGNQEIGDFLLNVDAQMVREIDNSTWDYITIMIRGDGFDTAWVSFEADDNNIPMVILTSPLLGAIQQFGRHDFPFDFQVGQWYAIQLEVRGSAFALSVDGEPVAQVDWSGQPTLNERGKVSLGAGGAEVHFDNFAITSEDVPDNTRPVTVRDRLVTTWAQWRAF